MSASESTVKPAAKKEHSPASQPERAIYGFFLLVLAMFLFIVYTIVSYLPNSMLNSLGWDYLPDKYWSIALPAYLIIFIIMILSFYFTLNMATINDHESINNITDEQALERSTQMKANVYSKISIDPIYDIPISEINRYLFKNKQ